MIRLFTTNFFKITFILIILGVFFYIMVPFMLAIILGGILAMALSPFLDFFILRGISRKWSLIIFTVLLGVTGFIPVIAFFIRGSKIISEILHESNFAQFSAKLTVACYKLIEKFSAVYGLDPSIAKKQVSSLIIFVGNHLSQTFSQFVAELPLIFMVGAVTTLSVYFFLSQSDKIRHLFDRYFHLNEKNGDDFIKMVEVCCREVFFTNIVTGLLQATIVSLGAYFFNAGDFFLVFFITFILSFMPVVGAAPVAVVTALICFAEGRSGAAGGMMLIAAGTSVSDNLIRPYLGTLGAVDVHPFIGLLAVIGGVMAFGFPGLFIGPMVASIYFGALPIIVDEYFPPKLVNDSDVSDYAADTSAATV